MILIPSFKHVVMTTTSHQCDGLIGDGQAVTPQGMTQSAQDGRGRVTETSTVMICHLVTNVLKITYSLE